MLLKNTYNEFIKILSKPRSYLGIGALTLLVGIIIFAMKADGKVNHFICHFDFRTEFDVQWGCFEWQPNRLHYFANADCAHSFIGRFGHRGSDLR